LIQFYSNNATNLHHLTTHSTRVLTYKMAIVLRPQICDVISPYLYALHCTGLRTTDIGADPVEVQGSGPP